MSRSVAYRLALGLLDLLAPAPCLGCGQATAELRPALGLCLPCRGRLRPPPSPACAACGRRIVTERAPANWLCGPCRRRRRPFGELQAAWRYEPPLASVIRAIKFARLDLLAADLATAMARELPRPEADLLVPVPLHWRRRQSRGFDQARRIADRLSERWAIPAARVLTRRRATPPQTGLSAAQRRTNLRGAFVLRRGVSPTRLRGRRIVLVDDVFTTGATLEAAASTLRRTGARIPRVLVAAATPAKTDGAPGPTA